MFDYLNIEPVVGVGGFSVQHSSHIGRHVGNVKVKIDFQENIVFRVVHTFNYGKRDGSIYFRCSLYKHVLFFEAIVESGVD